METKKGSMTGSWHQKQIFFQFYPPPPLSDDIQLVIRLIKGQKKDQGVLQHWLENNYQKSPNLTFKHKPNCGEWKNDRNLAVFCQAAPNLYTPSKAHKIGKCLFFNPTFFKPNQIPRLVNSLKGA